MSMSPDRAEIQTPITDWSVGRLAFINLGGAVVIAALMSTQFLAQPFVWQYFAGDEILAGWGLVFRDRLLVAVCIALTLTAALVLRPRPAIPKLMSIFAAIVIGALLGELLLIEVDPTGDRNTALGVIGRIIRWAMAAGAGCSIYYLWRRSEIMSALNHAAELRKLRAERLLKRMRIEALQRQIEPHFLFNTLATIRRLHRSNPAEGRVLLSRFFDFLRGSLGADSDGEGRLGDELAVASAYLDICAVRMDGALSWTMNVPEALKPLTFPRFGLATLLENAVKHGITPAAHGGHINVSARREGDAMELTVEDTGIGFAAEHGHGLGLTNIREQLALLYGSRASLSLAANRPTGVRAMIRVPLEPEPS